MAHGLTCSEACGIFPDGIELMFPVLAGRFFTTGPPGKSKCGPFFKVFIEFVTILLLFYVLGFGPRGMWDLSSLMRD